MVLCCAVQTDVKCSWNVIHYKLSQLFVLWLPGSKHFFCSFLKTGKAFALLDQHKATMYQHSTKPAKVVPYVKEICFFLPFLLFLADNAEFSGSFLVGYFLWSYLGNNLELNYSILFVLINQNIFLEFSEVLQMKVNNKVLTQAFNFLSFYFHYTLLEAFNFCHVLQCSYCSCFLFFSILFYLWITTHPISYSLLLLFFYIFLCISLHTHNFFKVLHLPDVHWSIAFYSWPTLTAIACASVMYLLESLNTKPKAIQ